MRSATELVDHL